MSSADVSSKTRGFVHPLIVTAARAVHSKGWRVTSIYRDSGSHATGRALDVCPLTMTRGGFGLKTAAALWFVVKRAVPQACWLANAELDHIHLQLHSVDALSFNTAHSTVVYPIKALSGLRFTLTSPHYL